MEEEQEKVFFKEGSYVAVRARREFWLCRLREDQTGMHHCYCVDAVAADKTRLSVTWLEKSYETKTGWVYRTGIQDTLEASTLLKEVTLEVCEI